MDTPNSTTQLNEKRCSRCGEVKPHAAFAVNRSHRDGLQNQCKVCNAEYRARNKHRILDNMREYYAQNSDRIKAGRKQRYDADPDRYRATVQSYRNLHPDIYRKSAIRYYRKNRELCVGRAQARRQQNRSTINQRQRERRRNNPESFKLTDAVHTHNRRKWAKQNGGRFTAEDLKVIRKGQTDKRGQVRCWYCGKPMQKWHIDHRVPLSRGGSNAPGNLCLACPECNLSKHNKLPTEYAGRLV